MPELENTQGNRWLTTLTLEKTDPAKVMEVLNKNRIESRPLWKPMHLQPLFKDALHVSNATSEMLFGKGLCLPSGTQLSYEEVSHISSLIRETLQ